MNYRNSVKILFSNFDHVWKMALYFLLLSVVSIFLLYLSISPMYLMLENSGVIEELLQVYTNFLSSLNLTEAFSAISSIVSRGIDTLFNDIALIWPSLLGIGLVVVFFEFYTKGLVSMPVSNSVNYYLGSINKRGFYASFSETLGKNLKFELCYYIVTLPFNVGIVIALIYSLSLFSISWVVSLIAIILLLAVFILLISLKQTLFSLWLPTYVIMNYGVFKSLRYSVKMLFRRFVKVFSGMVGVVLTIFLLNFILGVFTLGVGLLVSIPISFTFYNIYGMVSAYDCQGMRYYVDIYNVITPKKKENADKLSDMKYIV